MAHFVFVGVEDGEVGTVSYTCSACGEHVSVGDTVCNSCGESLVRGAVGDDASLFESKANIESEFSVYGLPCCVRVNPALGIRCGYVGVQIEDVSDSIVDDIYSLPVHGGVTYCKEHQHGLWMVFGFDCGHVGDIPDESIFVNANREYDEYAESMRELSSFAGIDGHVWSLEDVAEECANFAFGVYLKVYG